MLGTQHFLMGLCDDKLSGGPENIILLHVPRLEWEDGAGGGGGEANVPLLKGWGSFQCLRLDTRAFGHYFLLHLASRSVLGGLCNVLRGSKRP